MRFLNSLLLASCFLMQTSTPYAKGLVPAYHTNRHSNRNILGAGSNALEKNAHESVTLKVLAIRVDFQEQENRLTTGNGKFQFSADTAKTIDVPPHNLKYFADQLTALSNYYHVASRGQLTIATTVYPSLSESSFTVSQPMSYYVPAGDDKLLDTRLAEFFQEAFQVADSVGNIDFSAFDAFIVFHAGVGGDFAFDFDSTPQDMPSVFLDSKTLTKEIGNADPTYRGISVNGGSFFIQDGIILPETQSQDGFEIGLLGTMTIMFGNQLGVPLLFNPDNGRSGIGVFGLMDQGSGNFFGLVPALPCAWTRVFLGWETAIEVTNGENFMVAAPGAANENKIYKIPINSQEYFLIENRNRDINGDEIALGSDADGRRVEFHWDDNGQRLLGESPDGQPIGVITQISEYDFGLPGSGILIWHIDENVIAANFSANRVNANPEHRGIDLEEADGAQDIGQFYGFLSAGSGAENGVVEDMFWDSNTINICINAANPQECFSGTAPEGSAVEFTPFTMPNSLSNSGADAQIFITDFSQPDSIMTFTVKSGLSQAGFPAPTTVTGHGMTATVAGDLDGNGSQEIVVAEREGGRVFAWRVDGSKVIENDDEVAVFAQVQGNAFSPALAMMNGLQLVVVSSTQGVSGFTTIDSDSDGRADLSFEYTSSDTIRTAPMIVQGATDFDVIVGTESGSVVRISSSGAGIVLQDVGAEVVGFALLPGGEICYTAGSSAGLISSSGEALWQIQTDNKILHAPVVADLDQDDEIDVVFISENGELSIAGANGQLRDGFPRNLDVAIGSQLAVGNIDEDGFLEIVFMSRAGHLLSVNHQGFLTDNFPVEVDRRSTLGENEATFASPVLFGRPGQEQAEIVVGTVGNSVMAFGANGRLASGFPIASGNTSVSTPFISDLDGDGDAEMAIAAADGFMYVYDLDRAFSSGAVPWPGLFGGKTHANLNLKQHTVVHPGGSLLPAKLAYNYPNPTEGRQTTIRYTLTGQAQVKIRIFDLSGSFVDELAGPGFANVENEVVWPLLNVQSGVYLARIEAENDNASGLAIIKIAVVK